MILWVLTEWALVNPTHADVITLQGPDLRRKAGEGMQLKMQAAGGGFRKEGFYSGCPGTCGEPGGDGRALPVALFCKDPQCVLCGRLQVLKFILHRVPRHCARNFWH